jgi:hypothetical protein
MGTRNVLLLSALLSVWIGTVARADPVIQTFYETGCTPLAFSGSFCGPITAPLALGALTLPGPDSSGSASFNGINPASLMLTGDGNAFSFMFGISSQTAGITLAPSMLEPIDEGYSIQWSETAGQLTDISVSYHTPNGGAGVGLLGAQIGNDGTFGACNVGECSAPGFWKSDFVSEPSSLAILGAALAGLLLLTRRAASARYRKPE